MELKKSFIKKLNINIIKCPYHNAYFETIFCNKCQFFKSNQESFINCDFQVKPEFLKNIEAKSQSYQNPFIAVSQELKDIQTKKKIFSEIASTVINKEKNNIT